MCTHMHVHACGCALERTLAHVCTLVCAGGRTSRYAVMHIRTYARTHAHAHMYVGTHAWARCASVHAPRHGHTGTRAHGHMHAKACTHAHTPPAAHACTHSSTLACIRQAPGRKGKEIAHLICRLLYRLFSDNCSDCCNASTPRQAHLDSYEDCQ